MAARPDGGRITNLDHVASAVPSVVADGPASGCRALDLRVWGGIDVRLLPDRGFDVGAAWFAGVPLSWTSAVGECGPLDRPDGEAWLDRFGGGLITTCGLHNVGAPSDGHGLHGAISHRRATGVRTEREVLPDGTVEITARATVADGSAEAAGFVLERTVRTRTGTGLLELRDVVRNVGGVERQAPILYHVNVGAPLWSEGSSLELRAAETTPRDEHARAHPDWARPPALAPGAPERVYEHRVAVAPGAELAEARILSPGTGVALTLRWDAGTLPRLHQWIHPADGVYALALEPANCSVDGRRADRDAGRAPMLAAGATRTTRLQVQVGPHPSGGSR